MNAERHRRAARFLLLTLASFAATTAFGTRIRRLRTTAAEGDRFISLKDVARFYSMSIPPKPGRYVEVKSQWSDLRFETGSRKLMINDILVWLHAPTAKVKRRWSLTQTDMTAIVDPFLQPDSYLADSRAKVIVLDPGHGGKDRGAHGKRNVEEKRVVLDIARKARVKLANAGFKVYLTRDGDKYLTLTERTQKAARWKADVFVSIHLNSSTTVGAQGVETYVITAPGYSSTNARGKRRIEKRTHTGNKFEAQNMALGFLLQKNLLRRSQSVDRGLRRARFLVLKEAPCPAALVECGFVSNQVEEERFLRDSYRETIAQAIADGISEYAGSVTRARAAK